MEQVIAASKELNPFKARGFVVVDSSFKRVKVSSPFYVAMSLVIWIRSVELREPIPLLSPGSTGGLSWTKGTFWSCFAAIRR